MSDGSWSSWQDSAVSGSDSRQVDTREVAASYNMVVYVMSDSNSPSGRSYYSYRPSGMVLRANYTAVWDAADTDNGKTYPEGTYYKEVGVAVYGMIRGSGSAHMKASGGDVPFYIQSTNYKTQYRYRDRSKVYTYYYSKTENLNNLTSDPTGQSGVSDVVKYVTYIPK